MRSSVIVRLCGLGGRADRVWVCAEGISGLGRFRWARGEMK